MTGSNVKPVTEFWGQPGEQTSRCQPEAASGSGGQVVAMRQNLRVSRWNVSGDLRGHWATGTKLVCVWAIVLISLKCTSSSGKRAVFILNDSKSGRWEKTQNIRVETHSRAVEDTRRDQDLVPFIMISIKIYYVQRCYWNMFSLCIHPHYCQR